MATSPIYSWPEPDNTDLVKNGALAIRTLGDAIDTTMGTMVAKTIVDAKGDIIAATAADTVSRLAVGANNTVLTADSAQATGLKWATPSSSSLTSQSANLASNVTMTSANTYYDSVSISLAAGTWFIVAQTSIEDGGSNGGRKTAKLWDGTTVSSSIDGTQPTGSTVALTLSGIVVPTTTTTYKVSVAASQGSQTILATASTNGAGANVSHISAVKIA